MKNKELKNMILISIILWISACLIVYSAMAFTFAEINPFMWESSERGVLATFFLISGISGGVYLYLELLRIYEEYSLK